MNTQRTLSVLLIDDNKETILNLKANLEQDVTVDGLSTKIEVTAVHIQTEQSPECGCYRIKADTISELAQACGRKFHYIFSDFAFIGDRSKNDELRKKLLDENREVKESDLKEGTVLQCWDIKVMFENMRTQSDISQELAAKFQSNFLEHSGPIVVYTNSAKPFSTYFDSYSINARKNEVRRVFPRAESVEFILMHDEFSITPDIVKLFKPDEMKTYFSKLLSKKIESELRSIALTLMVKSQHKLRIQRTWAAFRFLSTVGIGFGAVVALWGEMLFHFLHDTVTLGMHWFNFEFDNSAIAHIFATLFIAFGSIALFSLCGVYVAKVAEKRIDDLLEHNR